MSPNETHICPFCADDGCEIEAEYTHDVHQKNGSFEEWKCPRCDSVTQIRFDLSVAEEMPVELQSGVDDIPF